MLESGIPIAASAPARPSRGDELPHLLDIPALADHLGVGVRHIRRLVAEDRIPYLKVGHFVRFDPHEVRQWLDQQRPPLRSHPRRSRRAAG